MTPTIRSLPDTRPHQLHLQVSNCEKENIWEKCEKSGDDSKQIDTERDLAGKKAVENRLLSQGSAGDFTAGCLRGCANTPCIPSTDH
ncbi:hypothetical protein CesoFtcFv8_026158 [Champsocephalus esox]|uniref:Uncharacterized protein n=1 Tax=Champsocephalus esox TaxID=159716 RepID=A0AAN8GCV2_9TELE|nr:hypothetical protein CesoFtcFv8_026158 [Champsocephalus esox]